MDATSAILKHLFNNKLNVLRFKY